MYIYIYYYRVLNNKFTNYFTYYTFKNPLSYAHLNKRYDLFTPSALINALLFCINILITVQIHILIFSLYIYIHVHMHTYIVAFYYSIFLYTLAKEKKILFYFPINTA